MVVANERAHTLWFETALLSDGWADAVRVHIAAGRIERIEANVAASDNDERHSLGIPAANNVHSHAFQRAIAGLTEHRRGADSFWSWREAMYTFVAELTPEHIEAITALAYLEMLEGGIARVAEFHYLHHARDGAQYANIAEHAERIAAAADEVGMGLTLLPVFYAHGGIGGLPPQPTQVRFVSSLDDYRRVLEASEHAVAKIRFGALGIAAHSLRAVTPEQLAEVAHYAGNCPIHIHVAEQMAEVADWLSFSGQRPVDWLLHHANVDARWCLVHATHVTAEEVAAVARSGATVGLCPITEANLGDGIFPAKDFLAHGGRFGIGTDSNVRIDVAEELRILEYGQRLMLRERNVLHDGVNSTGRSLYAKVARDGAAAVGQKNGELTQGALADIVSLSRDHVTMLDRSGDALLDSWIFGAPQVIDCVWSAGRKVVSAGHHPLRERIAQRYAKVLRALLQ
jgi:formimidoylglutamate deiminase